MLELTRKTGTIGQHSWNPKQLKLGVEWFQPCFVTSFSMRSNTCCIPMSDELVTESVVIAGCSVERIMGLTCFHDIEGCEKPFMGLSGREAKTKIARVSFFPSAIRIFELLQLQQELLLLFQLLPEQSGTECGETSEFLGSLSYHNLVLDWILFSPNGTLVPYGKWRICFVGRVGALLLLQ